MTDPSTAELLALRALERTADGRWVAWAVARLADGDDSPALRRLAAESPPFHHFEIRELTDRAFAERGLDRVTPDEAIRSWVRELLEEMLGGRRERLDTLRTIAALFDEHPDRDRADELHELWLLAHAVADLEDAGDQHYVPDLDLEDCDARVREIALRWLRTHGGAGADRLD